MSFRLVDTGWDQAIDDAARERGASLRIICPFIKQKTVERLLKHRRASPVEVITRFCLDDFAAGVSDLGALRLLMKNGARIRGIQNLHAKLYLFGERRAIVTSANLTESGLTRNHEFGFVAEDTAVVDGCMDYFRNVWERGGEDLTTNRVDEWEARIEAYRVSEGTFGCRERLGDEGTPAGIMTDPPTVPAGWVREADQSFIKFFGTSGDRAERTMKVPEEVSNSLSHRICSYPALKRPRQVRDGAIMFLGRLVRGPDDVMVIGRAVAMSYKQDRDDVTPAEIEARPWRKTWPHSVRLHDACFVEGILKNGVSMYHMMQELNFNAAASTQRHAREGIGNKDPRVACRRQAALKLTEESREWINIRFEQALLRHGQVSHEVLAGIDRPHILSDSFE